MKRPVTLRVERNVQLDFVRVIVIISIHSLLSNLLLCMIIVTNKLGKFGKRLEYV